MDGLEQELENEILIIRLNVQETTGRELASVYRFGYTPTFIFFDAQSVKSGGRWVDRIRSGFVIRQNHSTR